MITLTHRSDFLRVRDGGLKFVRPQLVLQVRVRAEPSPVSTARVGFTATKTLGGAVVRNRVKRRLRAAARALIASQGKPQCDYVLIGRNTTATCSYSELLQDLQIALDRLHAKLGHL